MKKILLFITALILLSIITNAKDGERINLKVRSASNGTCFDENSHLLNIGIGFGGFNYYRSSFGTGYVYSSSPAFSLTYEQAYPKKLGPGYLGIGAYVGYKTAHYRYDNYYYLGQQYYYEHRWNYMMFAARGVYHWDVLNSKNAEVYAGMLIGFRVTTYSYRTNSTDPDAGIYKRSDSGVAPVGALFAGARWYFVPNIALFGELGYGMSYATGGLTFKW